MRITPFLKAVRDDEGGATAIEYGLILALIFLGMISALQVFAGEGESVWGRVENKVTEAMN